MISKSRFTATSAKKQGPIHLHFVCISLILCVSNRNDAKHFIASLHLRHEISFYGDPIESEGIFLLSYFCSKQSIGCIRYMKQNLSKLMKVLNAEYPAEADWQQPRCWTIGLMNTPMCSRQDERMGSLSAGPASQFFFQRQSAFSTSKAENLSFKRTQGSRWEMLVSRRGSSSSGIYSPNLKSWLCYHSRGYFLSNPNADCISPPIFIC